MALIVRGLISVLRNRFMDEIKGHGGGIGSPLSGGGRLQTEGLRIGKPLRRGIIPRASELRNRFDRMEERPPTPEDLGVLSSREAIAAAEAKGGATVSMALRRQWNQGSGRGFENDKWMSDFVSSNIAAYKYDMRTEILTVKFRSGSIYEYYGVPPTLAIQFITWPESKGRFFWENIRGTNEEPIFPFSQIA